MSRGQINISNKKRIKGLYRNNNVLFPAGRFGGSVGEMFSTEWFTAISDFDCPSWGRVVGILGSAIVNWTRFMSDTGIEYGTEPTGNNYFLVIKRQIFGSKFSAGKFCFGHRERIIPKTGLIFLFTPPFLGNADQFVALLVFTGEWREGDGVEGLGGFGIDT